MTVGAADLALGDLGFDERPSPPITNQLAHIFQLVTQMIELQDHRIRLAAVDAWVSQEIVTEAAAILGREAIAIAPQPGDLALVIRAISRDLVLGEASAAPGL
jgi:hypothetical protein